MLHRITRRINGITAAICAIRTKSAPIHATGLGDCTENARPPESKRPGHKGRGAIRHLKRDQAE
jgi:hypothetical protein